ncbi:GIN domain-containing protein, partial [Robiginitalea sp.]|uniref:GIN domain-containing protein n=1 Tax=Robiginitalea sp. TaxID=1902411 RepID=UPI003C4DC76C
MKTVFNSSKSGLFFVISVLFTLHGYSQVKEFSVDRFNKVIVSPHISVTFVKGDSESVIIHSSTEPLEVLNVESSGKTLHLYLDNAKTTTKQEKVEMDGWSEKRSIYKGTVVHATVTYQVLDELSLRGEERFECKSPIKQSKFTLTIYGESEVYLEEVKLDNMNTTVYGESLMEISSGSIG